jgi:hypothetical protein
MGDTHWNLPQCIWLRSEEGISIIINHTDPGLPIGTNEADIVIEALSLAISTLVWCIHPFNLITASRDIMVPQRASLILHKLVSL